MSCLLRYPYFRESAFRGSTVSSAPSPSYILFQIPLYNIVNMCLMGVVRLNLSVGEVTGAEEQWRGPTARVT